MQDMNFHRARPAKPWWAWALLAASLLAAMAAADELLEGHRHAQERAAESVRLTAALQRQTLAAEGDQQRTVSRRDTHAESAGRQIERQRIQWAGSLHRPWLELFDAVERSSRPRVPLLTLAVDERFEGAMLLVEAGGLPELFDYVSALQQAGLPIQAAQLISHEWIGDAGTGDAGRRLRARISLRFIPAAGAAPADRRTDRRDRAMPAAREGA